MSQSSRSPAHCIAPAIIRKANAVMRLLQRRKLTLVTAESCTGGLIAAALSQAEGASDVLEGAFVTYTKAQKSKALGVRKGLLKREGAVTPQVAAEMAAGARRRSNAKLALSITGVLGPKSNAHGPNEFLHVPYARTLTACVAHVIAAHARAD